MLTNQDIIMALIGSIFFSIIIFYTQNTKENKKKRFNISLISIPFYIIGYLGILYIIYLFNNVSMMYQ